eukprot:gnl/TRDRNA2_/TRDRNA2_88194_c0_seq1.p1 gnl/TRDRNA2_/TRDRNA2_88194_c0~~gnl/TRDRNA2_/TRDRNA2_88194_c0_seq1.p1  ORF type:complete len:109 (-),score=15.12 gnl/TRDRNA2_/TRDRNA2_88194_c0_seq1:53-379(-)
MKYVQCLPATSSSWHHKAQSCAEDTACYLQQLGEASYAQACSTHVLIQQGRFHTSIRSKHATYVCNDMETCANSLGLKTDQGMPAASKEYCMQVSDEANTSDDRKPKK